MAAMVMIGRRMTNDDERPTVADGVHDDGDAQLRVHPGHDWFYVLEGVVTLHLGNRRIEVKPGEAAEFATMTPHTRVAKKKPAEVVMLFDHQGQRAHADD